MGLDKKVPHHHSELLKLLELAGESESILEIGSKYGRTLEMMARVMKGKRLVAVDLPNVYPWGDDSEGELRSTVKYLQERYDAHLFLGDSKDQEIVEGVSKLGPYDLVFIDGDHHYEGVKKDFENYGHLGKVVVFHDIVEPKPNERQELGVWRFWKELEGNKEEFIGDGSKMGLGIWKDN